jgi:hypothetical protein
MTVFHDYPLVSIEAGACSCGTQRSVTTVNCKQSLGCLYILTDLLDQVRNRGKGSFIADFLHEGDLNNLAI